MAGPPDGTKPVVLEVFWGTGIKTYRPDSDPVDPDDLDRPEPELLDLIGVPA